MRVLQGSPISWDPVIATTYHEDLGGAVVWSPCSRFITITKAKAVEILDAVTFNRLGGFESPKISEGWELSFSPDGRFLAQVVDGNITNWDLQTGGPAGTIPSGLDLGPSLFSSTAYSMDGKMVGAAYRAYDEIFINTYDLLSGTHKSTYHVSNERLIDPIWTHDEHLRFATVKEGSIIIWEVAFAFTHAPTKIKTFFAPRTVTDGRNFLFLPSVLRLAFTLGGKILVWDVEASRLLLESGSMSVPIAIAKPRPTRFEGSSFSSNGHVFASMTNVPEVYVWKESPTGYTLHQRLIFPSASSFLARPFLSPNGESIIVRFNNAIHLWPTTDEILSLPDVLAQESERNHILEFSSNETLVAFARRNRSVVTVLDLESGDPQLVIDAGLEIVRLGVTGSNVVVFGEGRVITWNLPTGDCAFNAKALNINDSIRTTILDMPPAPHHHSTEFVFISPDLRRIVTARDYNSQVEIYDVPTGRRLACAKANSGTWPTRFTPDGHQVWAVSEPYHLEGWEIIEDSESDTVELGVLEPTACQPEVFPWRSRRGYEVADDGWVLGPTRKRLLWLPHNWRSNRRHRTWSGRFLGLRHGGLSEVIILRFFE